MQYPSSLLEDYRFIFLEEYLSSLSTVMNANTGSNLGS